MLSKARSGARHNRGRAMRLPVLCGLLGLALALAPASALAQAPPPTLSLESMNAGTFVPGSTIEVTESCNPDGTGRIDFTASGTALGFYPGPFTASGSVTLSKKMPDPTAPFFKSLDSFTETFTINSPAGLVVGEKSGPLAASAAGICGPTPENVQHTADTDARYSALITLPSGERFFDRGTSEVHVSELDGEKEFREQGFSSDFGIFGTAQPCDQFKDKPGADKDRCKDRK
jgi:hypothetical protein